MKKTFLPFICSLLLVSCSTKKLIFESDSYDLYLLIGQSNMAGRGFLESEDTTTHPRVYVLNSLDTFVIAKEPLHYDKKNRGTGPGLEFGKKMAEYYPKAKIGLIPAAVGGTKVSYWTKDNDRNLFNIAVQQTKLALKKGKLKGIIWQQGESDSNSRDAPLYKEVLKSILNDLRNELDNTEVPIVVGGVPDFLKSQQYKTINNALQQIEIELYNVAYSEASKLGHIGDSLHFNSKAQRENGSNMAKKMIELQK